MCTKTNAFQDVCLCVCVCALVCMRAGTRPDLKGAMDKHDPNYESDEERTVVLHTQQQQQLKTELQVYKEKVGAVCGGCI